MNIDPAQLSIMAKVREHVSGHSYSAQLLDALAPLWASPPLRGQPFVEATDPWSAGATISGADTRVQIRNA